MAREGPWYGWGFGISWSSGPLTVSMGFGGWGGSWWGPGGYRPYYPAHPPPYYPGYRPPYYPGYRPPNYPGYRPPAGGAVPRPGTPAQLRLEWGASGWETSTAATATRRETCLGRIHPDSHGPAPPIGPTTSSPIATGTCTAGTPAGAGTPDRAGAGGRAQNPGHRRDRQRAPRHRRADGRTAAWCLDPARRW